MRTASLQHDSLHRCPSQFGHLRPLGRAFARTFERRLRPGNGPSRSDDGGRVVGLAGHSRASKQPSRERLGLCVLSQIKIAVLFRCRNSPNTCRLTGNPVSNFRSRVDSPGFDLDPTDFVVIDDQAVNVN